MDYELPENPQELTDGECLEIVWDVAFDTTLTGDQVQSIITHFLTSSQTN